MEISNIEPHSHDTDSIKIGVSACLLGAEVRFDGGHRRNHFVAQVIAEHAQLIPMCPEVEAGFSTPRETMRLVKEEGGVRLRGNKSGDDYTEPLESYSRAKVNDIKSLGISGFILKKDSPSCGLFRVKQYDKNNIPSKDGQGLFAKELKRVHSLLPIEEEGRLNDPLLRENFMERIYAYKRLTNLFDSEWTNGDLVAFHTREKLLLMAHSPNAYKKLGRYVANAHQIDREEFASEYQRQFMEALEVIPSVSRHRNVLEHMVGYFRDLLSHEDRVEMHEAVGDYVAGFVPLAVPRSLIKHWARVENIEWLMKQSYLDSRPKSLSRAI